MTRPIGYGMTKQEIQLELKLNGANLKGFPIVKNDKSEMPYKVVNGQNSFETKDVKLFLDLLDKDLHGTIANYAFLFHFNKMSLPKEVKSNKFFSAIIKFFKWFLYLK